MSAKLVLVKACLLCRSDFECEDSRTLFCERCRHLIRKESLRPVPTPTGGEPT